MEKNGCPGNVVMEQQYAEAGLAHSVEGYKMFVPICNKAVPACCMEEVWKALEVFERVHAEVYGSLPESMYIDGNLLVCLDRECPADRKYELRIVIITEDACGKELQDYAIEIPILPGNPCFAEARKCFAIVFLSMLECGGRDQGQGNGEENDIWEKVLK